MFKLFSKRLTFALNIPQTHVTTVRLSILFVITLVAIIMSTACRITFSCDEYPRYNYARKYVRPLIIRCQQMLNDSDINDTAHVPNFMSVAFLLEDPSLLNGGKWLTPKGSEPMTGHNHEVLGTDPVIRVFRYHKDSELDDLNEQECVFILKDNETCEVSKQKTQCVSQHDFPVFVGRLLEGHVFRWLRRKVEVLGVLQAVLASRHKHGWSADKTSEYNRRMYKSLQVMENSDRKTAQVLDASVTREKTSQEHLRLLGDLFLTGTHPVHSPTHRIRENEHAIEDLIAETMTMFLRHNIPIDELPDIDYKPTYVDGWMYEEIRSHIPNVKGCGMRYGTLCIELESSNSDQLIMKKLLENVRDLLKEKYQIRNIEVRENMHETCLSGRYRVGTKISTGQGYGTLGGFAMSGQEIYALLAKHVAGVGDELFYVADNDQLIKIGEMTEPVANPWIDIASARITEPIHDRLFKDPDGQSKPSKLYDLKTENVAKLIGQPAYIWGVHSRPGHGKITMVKHVDDNMKRIEIEDYDDEAKFAAEGDSGAVICAEDPDGNVVTAIGMLMGIRHVSSQNNGVEHRETYSGFFLQDGLEQLQTRHTENLSLC